MPKLSQMGLSDESIRVPGMQALLSDGPLEGRRDRGRHPRRPAAAEIEVDIEDGSVYAYVFDRSDDDAGVAVYTFKNSWPH